MKAKCVVWDLDNTIWSGTLLEDSDVKINKSIIKIIKELDRRGILQSIASKNNFEDAMVKLQEFGIADYFLYPQINWSPKSESLQAIATSLNIGIDTFAFLDDQDYELAEVSYHYPKVQCWNIEQVKDKLLELDQFIPNFVTAETSQRRLLYKRDIERNENQKQFKGTNIEFLSSLKLQAFFRKATVEDLNRVEELTQRTNQLNTTGITYSYEELIKLIDNPNYLVTVAELTDLFGSYGTIGLAVISKATETWCIELFLVSCRVISRNIGSIFLNWIRNLAFEQDVKLTAAFKKTEKNRMMYLTYKMMNFLEVVNEQGEFVFLDDKKERILQPDYMEITEAF